MKLGAAPSGIDRWVLEEENGVGSSTRYDISVHTTLQIPGGNVVNRVVAKTNQLDIKCGISGSHRTPKSASTASAARRPLIIAPWMDAVSR